LLRSIAAKTIYDQGLRTITAVSQPDVADILATNSLMEERSPMKRVPCIAAVLFVCLLASPCLAQTKLVVINTRDVLTKCDEGAKTVKAIEAKFADRKKQMAALEQEVLTLQEDVKAKGEKSPKFQELKTKAVKFQREDQRFRQDVNQEESQKFKPLADKIAKILSDYAKEKGIQGIQERGLYVYVDPGMDITDEIITKVNQTK
jgi:outer membrane protein